MQTCLHSGSEANHPGPALDNEKALLESLIDSLDQPQTRIEKVLVGPSLVAVLAGDRLGLASHLGAESLPQNAALPQDLTGATCVQAAELAYESDAYQVSIGVAALNAGLLPQASQEEHSIQNLVSELAFDAEAALVGQFPFTPWLRKNVGKLHLFELQPVKDRVPREKWEEVLARVKVAAITSTVFLTRHAHYYLHHAKNAVRILVGPSTPLSPRLFDYGADILAGSLVPDPERVMPQIMQGGCFSEVVRAGGIEFCQMRRPGLQI